MRGTEVRVDEDGCSCFCEEMVGLLAVWTPRCSDQTFGRTAAVRWLKLTLSASSKTS